ncbi:MAG: ribonuclease D [Planctomycetaceae bacterium]
MRPDLIEHQYDFLELCEHIREAGLVAFDTEFVSDAGYRSELGLLQFATRERCAAVDPLAIPSLAAWWDLMIDDSTTVVVHGGQAEVRFCIQQSGRIPQRLVDIQIAEGLRCRSYPLSYNSIVERVLGVVIHSNQTRSDWLRRPLTREQLTYALDDVSHVLNIWEAQSHWLLSRKRMSWACAEFDRMCRDVWEDEQLEPWQRQSGVHRLSRRELATLQKLAVWREEEAAARNRPPRRILRDDLLMDLAKRRPATVQQALATRDLNRPEYKRVLPEMIQVIAEAGRIPEDRLPPRERQRDDASSDDQIISRLLGLALSNVCAEQDVAQTLAGTNRDLIELVRYVRCGERSEVPLLLQGWRGELFGELLRKVLDGRVHFRVAPEGAATPLIFEDR